MISVLIKIDLKNLLILSVCRNLNVKTSKCKKDKLNSVNLTKAKTVDYKECGNYINPEFSRLSYPASNYRDMSVNRFYNLHHDPQETLFWNFATNTTLEAKDNFVPEIPREWAKMLLQKNIKKNQLDVVLQANKGFVPFNL